MKKIIIVVTYIFSSVIWLFFSILFTSALWLEGPGSKEWEEDAMFIPIGIIMLILWLISLIAVIIKLKSESNKNENKDK